MYYYGIQLSGLVGYRPNRDKPSGKTYGTSEMKRNITVVHVTGHLPMGSLGNDEVHMLVCVQ